jgi:PAS domain S-box-containing protein
VELLVEWVGAELDRHERERKLGELLEWTHELMRVETTAAAAETVVDAAVDVLGFEYTTVRLYDEGTGALSPVACSDGVREDFGEPPTRSVGEPGAGVAFERGEPVDYGPADEEGIESGPDADYEPLKASYILPLGDHGTFGIGSPVPDAFGGTDRQLAELLATTATAALDRVDRRQELARYEAVFETIRDMVFVLDEDGRATMVSEPLADRIGLDHGALHGRHVSEFVADGTIESTMAAVREMRDGDRTSVTVETVVESDEGEQFPGVAELSLLPGEKFRGLVGVLRDVTDLRETEAELATERDRFRRLFENLPDPANEVEFVDGEPRLRALNDAFADTFGVDPETVVGESANDVIVPAGEDRESTTIDERVRAGETVTAELQRETADGPRDFLFRGVPFETDRVPDRAFGIYTDVTDRRRRERHLQVLNRVLRHNLRNDLNAVLAFTDLITDRSTDTRVVELAEKAHEQAERLVSLSRQSVDIERTLREGGNTGPVDLEAVVTSVVADAREKHPEATVEVDVPDGTTVVAADRVRAALVNLVENAIDHHDGEPWVAVEVDPGGDTVAVRVIDDGPGIPEHERTVVTGESEITQLNHGSGLGLWLVKWVVEASGGDIAFHERDGGGSVVELTLRPADG